MSLGELVLAARRNLPLAALSLLAALSVAFLVLAWIEPSYRAVASVLIARADGSAAARDAARFGLDPGLIESQIELLGSREMAAKSIERAGLARDRDFASIDPEARIDRFLAALSIERVGSSYVLEIAVLDADPARAARIANAHAELFVERRRADGARRREERLSRARADLEATRQEIEAIERRLETARARAAIERSGASVLQARRIDLERRLAEAEQQVAEKAGVLDVLRAGGVDQLASSPLLQNLRAMQALALERRSELAGALGPRHPDRLEADRQLAALGLDIELEQARLRREARAALEAARAERAAAQLARDRLNARSPPAEAEAAAELARAELEHARLRLDGAQAVVRALESERPTPSDPATLLISLAAEPESPLRPRPGAIFGAALALWSVFAFSASWAREARDRSARTCGAIERASGLRAIGASPAFAARRLRDVGLDPSEPASLAHRKIAAQLGASILAARARERLPLVDLGPATLNAPSLPYALAEAPAPREVEPRVGGAAFAVLGLGGEGTSSETALALARLSAAAGRRALLIDADPAPKRDRILDAKLGLAQVLGGEASPAQACKRDAAGPLAILPCGAARGGLHHPERMSALLEQSRSYYQVVFVDLGDALSGESQWIAAFADAALIAVRWGAASLDELARVARDFAGERALARGPVALALTGVDPARARLWGGAERRD